MLDGGFSIARYRSFSRTFGNIYEGRERGRSSGSWDESWGLAPITPELVERLRLAYLELRSPEGDKINL